MGGVDCRLDNAVRGDDDDDDDDGGNGGYRSLFTRPPPTPPPLPHQSPTYCRVIVNEW